MGVTELVILLVVLLVIRVLAVYKGTDCPTPRTNDEWAADIAPFRIIFYYNMIRYDTL